VADERQELKQVRLSLREAQRLKCRHVGDASEAGIRHDARRNLHETLSALRNFTAA
jgi:hypothetical protein